MNDVVRLLRKNPALLIATAAVVGLAAGTGVIPLPSRLSLPARPSSAPAAAPATPPPPPDPIDAY